MEAAKLLLALIVAVVCFESVLVGAALTARQQILCKHASLRKLLSYCQKTNATCGYGKWTPYRPVSYLSSAENCSNGRRILFERTRTLRSGSPSACNASLESSEERCPLSTVEQIDQLQKMLGGNFGRKAVLQPEHLLIKPPTFVAASRRRRRTAVKNPKVTRNIAIILDASGSVGLSVFRDMVNNVAELISLLCYNFLEDGRPSDVRLALLVYADTVHEVFNFKTSEQEHTSVGKIELAIREAVHLYKDGMTATGPALRYAYDHIFTTANGMSPTASKRVLLVTDGKSNVGENPLGIAELLFRNKAVQVFPVGVGLINFTEIFALLQTVSNPKMLGGFLLLLLSDFSRLDVILEEVKNHTAGDITSNCARNVFKR